MRGDDDRQSHGRIRQVGSHANQRGLGSKSATSLPARQTRTVPSDWETVMAMERVWREMPAGGGVSGAESGWEAFGAAGGDVGAGGFDDAVPADHEGAIERGVFLEGFGHAVVEDVAFFLVVALEGVENELFGLFENAFVIADDEERADASSLPAVLSDLESEIEDAVEDGPFDVFVDVRAVRWCRRVRIRTRAP